MTDTLTSPTSGGPGAGLDLRRLLLRMPRRVVARVLGALARAGVTEPFVTLCARAVQVHTPGPEGAVTVLALNIGRFRGDLECLGATGKFRILTVPYLWQGRLYDYFYAQGQKAIDAVDQPEIKARQRVSRAFFRKFLPLLYARLKVDAVIGASFLYLPDHDWGAVSHELGVPFLVFMREGNVASVITRQTSAGWGRRLGKFHGTFLVLQNELQRRALIETGYIDENNSAAAGNMRMDHLVAELRSTRVRPDGGPKRVAFFSFGPGTAIPQNNPPHWPQDPENYLYQYCRKTHVAVAKFAAENPDVEVVFKPKWGGNWNDRIRELARTGGIDIDTLPNVSIQPDVNVHRLLGECDLVIGYGTTVLLEAAISGLPVILPLFDEIMEPRWRDYLMYAEDLDCFDVADSPEALGALIDARLRSGDVSPEVTELREKTFEKYVSRLDGRATERYADIILSQVRRCRDTAGEPS